MGIGLNCKGYAVTLWGDKGLLKLSHGSFSLCKFTEFIKLQI